MNPFQTAQEEGYSAERILDFFVSKNPKIRNKVRTALQAGHTASEIVKFFDKQFSSRRDYGQASQQAIHGEKRQEDREKNKELLKAGAGLAAGLLTGPIGRRLLPAASQGVSKIASMAKSTAQAPVTSTLASEGTGANLAQSVAPEIVKDTMGEKAPDYLGKYFEGLTGKKPPPKEQREFAAKSLRDQFQEGYGNKKQVLLPDGELGDVVSEKQGINTIQLPSGQTRTKKAEELIAEPEEAAVKALELIKSFTPEQQRSSHHALSFYDPDDKEAYFMFHNGNAYRVDDISPEEYERLSTEVDMAKTTGGSPYGIWATGEGSRGAAYHQIVKKLNKPYKKLHVGYNILKNWQDLLHEHTKKEKRKTSKRKSDEEADGDVLYS